MSGACHMRDRPKMPLFRWYYDKSVVAHGGWRRSLHLWIRGKHRLTVRW